METMRLPIRVVIFAVTIVLLCTTDSIHASPNAYLTADSWQFPLDDGSQVPDQDFGWGAWNSYAGGYHLGQDFYRDSRKPVRAAANGYVYWSRTSNDLCGGYGYVVLIEHRLPDNSYYVSLYGHLEPGTLYPENSAVNKGDIIGYLSTDSCVYGPHIHLHFGIREGTYTLASPEPSCWNNWPYPGYSKPVGATTPCHGYSPDRWRNGLNFIRDHNSSSTGNIFGYVKDSTTSSGISGALVTFQGSPTSQTVTDSNGYYSFTGKPVGSVTISASKSGYNGNSVSVYVSANVSTKAPDINLTPSSGCGAPALSFQLGFQGINGYNPNNSTKTVTIKVGIPGQAPIKTQQVLATRTSDGSYTGCASLTGLTLNQAYYVLVKAPGFLQRKYDAYVLNSTINLRDWRGIPLLAGDLDGNNVLSLFDVATVLGLYTALSVPVPSGTVADITADNKINIIDVSQVLANFTALTVPGDDWNYQRPRSPNIPTNSQKKLATTSTLSSRQSTSLTSPLWTNFVNVSMSPSQALYPTIATGNDGTTYVVWTDGRSGSGWLYFASRPLGYYWSNPELVPSSGNGYSAQAAVDSNGVLHVVFHGGVFPADIFYTSRQTNGTWTSPINLSNSQGGGIANVDKPKIAVDNAYNVHVVWQGDSGTTRIYYASKPSSGGWNSPIVISNDAVNSYTPALTTDQNNNVYAVWQSAGVFYSQKSGSSWSSPIQVGSQNAQKPAIVAKSTGELHITAQDANGSVVHSSKPLGGSWSEMVPILSGATDAQIALDSSDRLHVIAQANGEILEMDEGADGSFSAPTNLSKNDGQSLTPQIALTNYTIEAVWQDNSSGLEQIYFSDGWPQNGLAPLRFDPESMNIAPGNTITTSVYFNSTGIPLSGMVISGTYQYTGATPDLEPSDKIQINPDLVSNNWGVSVNQIITNPGSVTIELSLINNDQTGYVSPGEMLLGTIRFRSTRPFPSKTISWDTELTTIVAKATASNILKMQNNINYSSGSTLYLPLIKK